MAILRELKSGELTLKDMSSLREDTSAREQSKRNSGSLREFSLNHDVKMGWNDDAARDKQPFVLSIDRDSYVLSWGELAEMDSRGFFRREEGNPTKYTLKHFDGKKVSIDVELNEEAQRDMIIHLKTDKADCYLDWYQIMRLGRFI